MLTICRNQERALSQKLFESNFLPQGFSFLLRMPLRAS